MEEVQLICPSGFPDFIENCLILRRSCLQKEGPQFFVQKCKKYPWSAKVKYECALVRHSLICVSFGLLTFLECMPSCSKLHPIQAADLLFLQNKLIHQFSCENRLVFSPHAFTQSESQKKLVCWKPASYVAVHCIRGMSTPAVFLSVHRFGTTSLLSREATFAGGDSCITHIAAIYVATMWGDIWVWLGVVPELRGSCCQHPWPSKIVRQWIDVRPFELPP
jgi:hypothetical protein